MGTCCKYTGRRENNSGDEPSISQFSDFSVWNNSHSSDEVKGMFLSTWKLQEIGEGAKSSHSSVCRCSPLGV